MSLLLQTFLYLAVGCDEWYLALRRTLACSRGEKKTMVVIVFFENLLGLWVLSSFVRSDNWLLALAYSFGGAAGAILMGLRNDKKISEKQLPSN